MSLVSLSHSPRTLLRTPLSSAALLSNCLFTSLLQKPDKRPWPKDFLVQRFTHVPKNSQRVRGRGERVRERVQQIRNESKSKAAITSSSSASAHPGLEQGHVELFLPARSARLVYRFLIVFLFSFSSTVFPRFSLLLLTPNCARH